MEELTSAAVQGPLPKPMPAAREPGLHFRQGLTIALLFAAYSGYYLCRSNFSVALPLMVDDFSAHGMTPDEARIRLGGIASLGVVAYAAGKVVLSWIADFLGGKRNLLGGMAGAILFTILFAMSGGWPILTLAWIGNRASQAGGWSGIVKITSRWFSYKTHGTIMGIIALSYLFGDAAARQFMGWIISKGVDWRTLFLITGGTLFGVLVVNLILLRESRAQLGFSEPEANPASLFATEKHATAPGLLALLRPFFTSPAFGIVCLFSVGATLVREAFNTWTPAYFHQVAGYSQAESAGLSALFPLFGGFSVLTAGYLGDRLGRHGRSIIMFFGMLLAAVALFALAGLNGARPRELNLALVALVAFGLIGPYAYLSGAIALDFGGRQGGGASAGLIDGVGYLGGILAGDTFARVLASYGWHTAFMVLSCVCVLSSIAATALYHLQRRTAAA